MSRTTLIGAIMLAALSIASPATAETHTLTGTIESNPGSKIIIKVQRVGGDPLRIKSFEFRRVAFTCFGATPGGRINGTVGTMKVEKGPNPFNPRTRTNVYFSRDGQLTEDRKIGVFITGIVNRKATRTSGNIGISFGDGCSADAGTGFSPFKATR
ncbi:MAG: hypothetical protein H6528_04965 [Actinobacteria bacterium]|nr:hypothetical protein [Actinomycetota bacterium]MCB8996630.1 hypothetical protein [Actinomycetota bacterium]